MHGDAKCCVVVLNVAFCELGGFNLSLPISCAGVKKNDCTFQRQCIIQHSRMKKTSWRLDLKVILNPLSIPYKH